MVGRAGRPAVVPAGHPVAVRRGCSPVVHPGCRLLARPDRPPGVHPGCPVVVRPGPPPVARTPGSGAHLARWTAVSWKVRCPARLGRSLDRPAAHLPRPADRRAGPQHLRRRCPDRDRPHLPLSHLESRSTLGSTAVTSPALCFARACFIADHGLGGDQDVHVGRRLISWLLRGGVIAVRHRDPELRQHFGCHALDGVGKVAAGRCDTRGGDDTESTGSDEHRNTAATTDGDPGP